MAAVEAEAGAGRERLVEVEAAAAVVEERRPAAEEKTFRPYDPDQLLLMAPDLREWVAENDLAHLVLEAVELCDMRGAQLNVRGSGSEQYPPGMMMALLIYAYCTGLFSSRRIERATYDSVALRYLCANHHPDHDTIAKFRREKEALFRKSFGQVLLMTRIVNVQPRNRKAKPYQVKQVRELLLKYKIDIE